MKSNISTKALFKPENQLHLPQCQSTNDLLWKMIKENSQDLPEGFLLRTDFQTSGRGQKGNVWYSAPHENLLFSFFLKPQFLSPKHSFWLSAAVAIGLAKTLEKWLADVKVKWPNDVLAGGKKIAGILIENTISGTVLDQSVVGIGLNINQIDLDPRATSFLQILHKKIDADAILHQLKEELSWAYFQLQLGGWETIKRLYYLSLFRMGVPSDFTLQNGEKLRGLIKGISEEGRLLIVSHRGEESFAFKEISLQY